MGGAKVRFKHSLTTAYDLTIPEGAEAIIKETYGKNGNVRVLWLRPGMTALSVIANRSYLETIR